MGIGIYDSFLEFQEIQKPWHEQEGPNSFAFMRGVTSERDYLVCTLSLYPMRCTNYLPDWYLEKLEERKYAYLNETDRGRRFLLADRVSPEPEHSIYTFAWKDYKPDRNEGLRYDPWVIK